MSEKMKEKIASWVLFAYVFVVMEKWKWKGGFKFEERTNGCKNGGGIYLEKNTVASGCHVKGKWP